MFGEAVASILATPWRFVAVTAVLAGILCFPAYRDVSLVHSLQSTKQQEIDQGEFVSVVTRHGSPTANNGFATSGISGEQCDSLSRDPGIRSSGVLSPAGTAVVASEPDGGIPLWHVSPGFVSLAGGTGAAGDVAVGSEAASELGLTSGSRLSLLNLANAEGIRAEVLPADGPRTAILDRAVLVPQPPARVGGTCFVETIGTPPNSAAEWLGALLDGTEVDVRPLVAVGELGRDPHAAYESRPDAWLGLVSPVLAVLVWALLLRVRRSEIALARIFGAPRTMVTAQLVIEFGLCMTVALIPAVSALAGGSWGDQVSAAAGIATLVQGCASAMLLAVPCSFLLSVRRGSELRLLRGAE